MKNAIHRAIVLQMSVTIEHAPHISQEEELSMLTEACSQLDVPLPSARRKPSNTKLFLTIAAEWDLAREVASSNLGTKRGSSIKELLLNPTKYHYLTVEELATLFGTSDTFFRMITDSLKMKLPRKTMISGEETLNLREITPTQILQTYIALHANQISNDRNRFDDLLENCMRQGNQSAKAQATDNISK